MNTLTIAVAPFTMNAAGVDPIDFEIRVGREPRDCAAPALVRVECKETKRASSVCHGS